MKKKLVSILLSLSMCASFAMPLTSAAADKAPADDVVVEETVAPSAERTPEVTSTAALKMVVSGSATLNLQYGDKIKLKDQNWYKLEGTIVDSNFNPDVSLELLNSGDTKYISANGNEINTTKITKNAVPVMLKVSGTSYGQPVVAEMKMNINVNPCNLAALDSSKIKSAYKKDDEGKTYKSLAEFQKKYKGAKGLSTTLTLDNGDAVLGKADIKSVSAKPDTDNTKQFPATGTAKYYTVKGSEATITGGSIVTTASITVEGKGNYTGKFTITGQPVNLYPQRINAGVISAATITFGSVEMNLVDGLTIDDYKKPTDSDDPATVAKLFKFSTKSKNIKINSKDGTVTVKSVDPKTEANNEATVTITSKKNKDCVQDVTFVVTQQSISGDAFAVDIEKVVGTDSKPKTYKNLVDFKNKFMGKTIKLDQFDLEKDKVKATGLVFTYTDPKTSKKSKLKVNKDFTVVLTPNGDISKMDKKGNLEPTAYLTKNGEVVTTASITIVGKNNYCGIITKANVFIPMEIQTVTAAGQNFDNGITTVTYGGVNEVNIFDNISIDNATVKDSATNKVVPQKLSASADKDKLAKLLKIKADKESGLKVDKDGYVSVKNVPQSGKGKITISAKRNNKSVDASFDVEFDIAKATITSANVRFDTGKIEGKTFANKEAAKKTAEKLTILATVNGKDVKLKAGSNKDFSSIVVTQDPSKYPTGSTATGPSLKFDLSAQLRGNYTGTLNTEVNCTAKK